MAEYSNVPVQTVTTGNNVLFTNGNRACRKGYVVHRNDSGVITLRGITNQCRAAYRVQFTGNVAISAGETVAPISIALALNGESLGNATAIVTPAAVGNFFNVSVSTFVDVPRGCCLTLSVKNITADTSIDVENANIVIDRTG